MVVLAVLAIGWIAARLAGRLGVESLNSWRKALPYALALMFLFTSAAHFNSMRSDMIRMTPDWVPNPAMAVTVTGILEILGAIGLMIPKTRRIAAIALIAFLLAVFPANVRAAQEDMTVGGRPATPLVLRAPMQLLFIGLLVGCAARPGSTSGRRTAEAQ